ncbi:unnamed protein product [Parascedosporium putredinis]|uniref:Uncharacterized protein n=1 Tax=Parascedosporium putredinis TaxID=1442378 RepID=A0A9P1MAE9_9PEZI|nr:unnamed protein product [Parascedosporium putredinis]CAI7992628.1 unnamed protein product [Parascedosporium putredinis]
MAPVESAARRRLNNARSKSQPHLQPLRPYLRPHVRTAKDLRPLRKWVFHKERVTVIARVHEVSGNESTSMLT